MLPLILLASLSGQVDSHQRQWLPAVVDGRTVMLWGWRDASGGVRHYPGENPHVYRPAVKPRPVAPLAPGQTLGKDGAINNGLLLESTPPGHRLDTNDPDLGRKLQLESAPCPGPGPCPKPEPTPQPAPTPNPLDPYREYMVPGAAGVAVLFIIAALIVHRSEQ